MEDDAPVIYGLEFQARALTAQIAETDTICFLVGTQSLRFENQVHFIEFDDENNLINKTVFLHSEGEIWNMSSSPLDKDIFSTVYNKCNPSNCLAEMKVALWKLPENSDVLDDSSSTPELLKLSDIPTSGGDVKSMIWQPSGDRSETITITDHQFQLWDIAESGKEARLISHAELEGKGQPKFTSGRWNPHHNCTQIATANDTAIRGWDLRSMKQVYCIESAHGQMVRDLDFNPNKQYYLASCGDDCRAKFWDIRNPTQPLKILADHSHWIWGIRYNHFHDQLVLTSSSDSRVILTNAVSISSEPFGQLVEEDECEESDTKDRQSEVQTDGVIATYEEHEDSVYAVEWSTADPWLFASLSYDGRLVINRVPRSTKYKILL